MLDLRPLKEEERLEICHVISQKMTDEDRDSHTIIEEDYGGDVDEYLRTMAGLHNVPIGIDRIFLKLESFVNTPNIHHNMVVETIGDLSKEEIDTLVDKLMDLRKKTVEKLTDDISEIVDTARSDSALSSGEISSGMGDFYDNDVAAAQVGANKTFSGIDKVIKIITEISKNVA